MWICVCVDGHEAKAVSYLAPNHPASQPPSQHPLDCALSEVRVREYAHESRVRHREFNQHSFLLSFYSSRLPDFF